MIDTGTPDVTVEIDDGVATVTIDRPEARNAVRTETVDGLRLAARALDESPEVRVAVLTGSGDRFFCPGADLGGPAEPREPATDREDPAGLQVWRLRAAVMIHDLPQITIAAVNGACAGAGLGFAAACDIRVAAEGARFATAFLEVAVAGDMGLPWTLSRIVGPARARELFLLGGKFDAARALEVGLVSAVYPDEAFRRDVAALVGSLKRYDAGALRALKENFLASERMGFADYQDLEHERHLRLVRRPDFAAAAESFRQARRSTRHD